MGVSFYESVVCSHHHHIPRFPLIGRFCDGPLAPQLPAVAPAECTKPGRQSASVSPTSETPTQIRSEPEAALY
jgi:hypothetical protein